MSGSSPFDHRYWVSDRATTRDTQTAQQKKTREKMANKIGSFIQPKLFSIVRKMISIGTVTRMSVTMTSREEGPESLGDMWDAVACREVESREINIDPTLPGSPLMTTARRGNPGYLEANISSTIPVPQLMTIAPKRGVQPCHMRSLTTLFPRTTTAHASS